MRAGENVDFGFDVDVKVTLPQPQYKQLSRIAAANRLTVAALVRECVRRQLVPSEPRGARTKPNREAIRELHLQGMSDLAISKRLGCAQSTVSKHRADMGFPALFNGRPSNDERRAS